MHRLTTRPPTPDELQTIAARTGPDVASAGCLLIFASGLAAGLGKVGQWFGELVSPVAARYGQWIGWAVAVGLTAPLAISVMRYGRRQRELAQSDRDNQVVQDIHVVNPRVVEVALVGNVGPNLAIELSDDTILYLQGQWLYDNTIYDAPLPENDEGDDRFNGLPAPHSFPCTEFTLSRLPNSGEVLRIRVAGEYLGPEPAVEALKVHHQFQPSEIFHGPIAELADIMDREHAARQTK